MFASQAFDYGYIILQQAVAPHNALLARHSVLGRVVRVTDHVLQYRRWVRDTFEPFFFPQRIRPRRPHSPDRSPDRSPDQSPDQSPEPTPDQSPDGTPDPSPSDTEPVSTIWTLQIPFAFSMKLASLAPLLV